MSTLCWGKNSGKSGERKRLVYSTKREGRITGMGEEDCNLPNVIYDGNVWQLNSHAPNYGSRGLFSHFHSQWTKDWSLMLTNSISSPYNDICTHMLRQVFKLEMPINYKGFLWVTLKHSHCNFTTQQNWKQHYPINAKTYNKNNVVKKAPTYGSHLILLWFFFTYLSRKWCR